MRDERVDKPSKLRQSIRERLSLFDKYIKKASTKEVALTMMREKKRWLCRNDLFYLLCITGHNSIAKWKDVYQPFCDQVSLMTWKVVQLKIQPPSEMMIPLKNVVDNTKELKMQRMFLCYRAFYKTTVITIGHSCQLLLNFPNIHIVLCHNRQDTSSKNLVAIKNLFLNTPKLEEETKKVIEQEYGIKVPLDLKTLFPECVPDQKKWDSTEKFSLANRTDWQRPEPNVQAVGADTEITGGHWDVAKKNDLVTEKSINTEDQINKTRDWDARFNQGHFVDTKFPLQDYEGTRYHFLDLYSTKLEKKNIHTVEVPIVKDLVSFLKGDDTQITHPQRYSRSDIMNLYDDDRWVFMCQMMLKPEDPSKKRFTPDMIHRYDALPEVLRKYLLVDPAGEQKKRSDYTAMTVVGISPGNKYYIVDMIRDKMAPDQKTNKAIELIKRHDIKDVGWEKIGLNNDTFYLEERRKQEGLNFRLVEIDSQTRSKIDRIRDILVPQYTRGQWLWPNKNVLMYFSQYEGKTIDMIGQLETEMMQFPNGLHDDMLDTLTFLMQMSPIAPIVEPKVEYLGMTFGEYTRIKEDRLARQGSDPWSRMDRMAGARG